MYISSKFDDMLLIVFLVFASSFGVNGQCMLKHDYGKENGVCRADIGCVGTTANILGMIQNDWSCIKRMPYQYNYDYGSRMYKDNFVLYLTVEDGDINTSEDPFYSLTDVSNNVKKIIIENGNLVSIPPTINTLSSLIELSITYNKIEMINLSKYAFIRSMEKINVSHNCISTVEVNFDNNGSSNSIFTIDLSYNSLEIIPDNTFLMFSNLRYLDLSHNLLTKFDILTFEGIIQLETLLLSNNKLFEIGQNFARFFKLKTLVLDNNQLTSLTDLNFRTMVNLEKLNISSNMLKNLDDLSLANLKKLKQLDLSCNDINVISDMLFINNTFLDELSLSHNYIERIEAGAFKTNNISHFDIKNNYLSGAIEYDTFRGIFVKSLDLSGGKLTELRDKAFSAMGSSLKYLNLSNNVIQTISDSAFLSLNMLTKLDLSYNRLFDINFETKGLIDLTEYYLQKNNIKKITSKMFRNLTSLIKLDISQNKIEFMESNSFIDLINLQTINISHNHFVYTLTANIFRGLQGVSIFDASNTRLMFYLNESFSGMVALTHINSSCSQIETIEYDVYKSTGGIKVIDLSHNMLEHFEINTSSIPQLSELYLNNNKLRNITNETFKHLRLLKKLNIASNNIMFIESSSLQTLPSLHYVDIFSNMNLHFKDDLFNHLVLAYVSLESVKKPYSFENSKNTSIETLILSHCDIDDVNLLQIYNIRNVLKLDISSNKIRSLDKMSFQNMTDLIWLDLSINSIASIQPGSFRFTNMINFLNLYGNNLQYLQYGVLDGLSNLRILNLSSNAIRIFGINFLHNIPHLERLSLDNNDLPSLEFEKFANKSIGVLSIGGNSISCEKLLFLKKHGAFYLNITAERLDFDSENVDGISCKTSLTLEVTKNISNNINISSEVIKITTSLERLYSYLKGTQNETFSKIIASLEKISAPLIRFSDNLNRSQDIFIKHLEDLFTEHKNILSQLLNAKHDVANDTKTIISLLDINNNITKLIYDKAVLKQEHKISTDLASKIYTSTPKIHGVKLDENTLGDIKVLLYFIAVCIAIVVILYVLVLINKYTKLVPRMSTSNDCGLSGRTGIEME